MAVDIIFEKEDFQEAREILYVARSLAPSLTPLQRGAFQDPISALPLIYSRARP
jgi:hypothetical protein